jgi:hypothetical protein
MPESEELPKRVESLNVKDREGKTTPEKEKDYVYVDRNMETLQIESAPEYSPCSETISISKTEQWEEELMQDPKVYALCILSGHLY